MGASSLETQSKNFWAGASPFSVKTFKAAGTAVTLAMVNNDLEPLTLTDISIGGTSVFSTATVFNSGQSIVVVGTLPAACGNAGDPFQYENVKIIYSKGSVTGLTYVGAKPLVGKCS